MRDNLRPSYPYPLIITHPLPLTIVDLLLQLYHLLELVVMEVESNWSLVRCVSPLTSCIWLLTWSETNDCLHKMLHIAFSEAPVVIRWS